MKRLTVTAFATALCLLPLTSIAARADDFLTGILRDHVPDNRAAEIAVWHEGDTYSASVGLEEHSEKLFVLASVSKAVLAVAILQLYDDGILDVTDPISDWVEEDVLSGIDGADGVTVANLLTMRSGLPEYLNMFYMTGWFAGLEKTHTVRGALTYAHGLPSEFQPGARFAYTNTNYLLAQLVLESASGMSMSQYFETNIFTPSGMTRTDVMGFGSDETDIVEGYGDLFGDGNVGKLSKYYSGEGFGDGGLATRAADVVAFYKALLVDRTLLSDNALQLMITTYNDRDNYGMGLVVEGEPGTRDIGHNGAFAGFLSDAFFLEEHGLIGAILVADRSVDLNRLGDDVIDAVLE